ncbi:replication endonuclease [Nitrospirillum sp. BR 11752]|uniref:replication endonuclease n=1 Tax=Nitrospirillum sp. BR 11752 TaxID=3104293 RepID=UPI002ECBACBC|nr:replication endonuclease [Nitrospirillum sp. BR 11752]
MPVSVAAFVLRSAARKAGFGERELTKIKPLWLVWREKDDELGEALYPPTDPEQPQPEDLDGYALVGTVKAEAARRDSFIATCARGGIDEYQAVAFERARLLHNLNFREIIDASEIDKAPKYCPDWVRARQEYEEKCDKYVELMERAFAVERREYSVRYLTLIREIRKMLAHIVDNVKIQNFSILDFDARYYDENIMEEAGKYVEKSKKFAHLVEGENDNIKENTYRRLTNVKWWSKYLREISIATLCHLEIVAGMVHGRTGGQRIIGKNTLNLYMHMVRKNIEHSKMQGVRKKGEKELPQISLYDVIEKSAQNKMAKFYAISTALDEVAERNNFIALFVTVTAPKEYHLNPKNKNKEKKGENDTADINYAYTPKDSSEYIMTPWKRVRAALKKGHYPHFGCWGQQPHDDGTAHLHIIIHVPRGAEEEVAEIFFDRYGVTCGDPRRRIDGDPTKKKQDEKFHPACAIIRVDPKEYEKRTGKKGARASTYVSRYVNCFAASTISTAAASDGAGGKQGDTLKVMAWASANRLRRGQFFGLSAGTHKKWDILYAKKDSWSEEAQPWEQDRGRSSPGSGAPCATAARPTPCWPWAPWIQRGTWQPGTSAGRPRRQPKR